MKRKHQIRSWFILTGIILLIIGLTLFIPGLKNFSSPSYIRDFLLNLGSWGYFIYILLFIASVPLPIPSSPLALGGGYVYGTWLGTALTLIGLIIGASISFFLVRMYGKNLVENLIEKRQIIHFNHLFKERGMVAALTAYAIPIIPADALDFLLGLTKVPSF